MSIKTAPAGPAFVLRPARGLEIKLTTTPKYLPPEPWRLPAQLLAAQLRSALPPPIAAVVPCCLESVWGRVMPLG